MWHELLMLTDGCGYSCLHAAALYGHAEVVELLVEDGGRAASREGMGCTRGER